MKWYKSFNEANKESGFALIPVTLSLIIYITVAFGLQMYENSNVENNPHPDTGTYLNGARLLYQHGFTPEKHRPIGISLILGIPYLFDSSEEFLKFYILILQFFCWAGIHILLFLMVKEWIKTEYAIWVIPLYTCFISPLYYVFFILSDTLFTFFIFFATYCLQKFFITRRGIFLVFFCGLLFYGAIIKPVIYFLSLGILIVIIILWILKIVKKPEFRWIHVSLIFLAWTLTIGFQLGIMYDHFGVLQPTLQSERVKYYMTFMARSIEHNENPAKTREKLDNEIGFKMIKENKTWEKVMNEKFDTIMKTMKFLLFRGYLSSLKSNITEGSGIEHTLKNYRNNSNFSVFTHWADIITSWENKIQFILFSLNGFLIMLFYLKNRNIKYSPWFLTVTTVYILCAYLYIISGVVFWGEGRYSLPQFPLNIFIFSVLSGKLKSF